ncbi:uncharacterized protein DSM5745_03932 [Aspergillus mulundensis]|uniref:F-box domain-containing protein n=1 Tax=Aspergillus mulundensis TaxID=1810919 RepID=A0A3D8SBB2_9EURO|nr:hypothetical protein DSM5745_03932 [Aspergillus mulundensis]RDW83606.1 hypothetical protein DSM5745_03932 [Aspergillus mulundensis]
MAPSSSTSSSPSPSPASTFLNHDCAILILQNLDNIHDIAACQRVNRAWRDRTRDYIANHGLKKHFPDSHAAFLATVGESGGEPYQRWEEFAESASETALYERWVGGRPVSTTELVCRHYVRAGKFIVWQAEDHSVYWRWAGYQDSKGTPYPDKQINLGKLSVPMKHMAVCTEAETLFLIFARGAARGLAKLAKWMPRSSRRRQGYEQAYEQPEHMQYMVDLQTGDGLWARSDGVYPRDHRTDYNRHFKFGWTTMYEVLANGEEDPAGQSTVEMFDIRTGEPRGTLTIPTGNDTINVENLPELRIVRLGGSEVLMTLHTDVIGYRGGYDSEIRFTRTNGSVMGSIGLNLANDPRKPLTRARIMVPERRHGPLAFAVLAYSFEPDTLGRKILAMHTYTIDEAANFLSELVEEVDLDALYADYSRIELDPFRGFMVGVLDEAGEPDRNRARGRAAHPEVVVMPIVPRSNPRVPRVEYYGLATGTVVGRKPLFSPRPANGRGLLGQQIPSVPDHGCKYEPDGEMVIQGTNLAIDMHPTFKCKPPEDCPGHLCAACGDCRAVRFVEFGFPRQYNRPPVQGDTLHPQDHS